MSDEKSDFDKLVEWFAPVKPFWDSVKCIDAELGRHEEGDPECPDCRAAAEKEPGRG